MPSRLLLALLVVTASAASAQQNIRQLVPDSAARIVGDAVNDLAGSAVSVSGDFNGDGIEDLAVSAPNADVAGIANAGEVYVFFGQRGARNDFSIAELRTGGSNAGFIVSGEANNGLMGRTLAAVDINGDQIDDLAIGAPQTPNSVGGLVYILFGTPAQQRANVAIGQLRTADNSQSGLGVIFAGPQPGANHGAALVGLDDYNGDGLSDMYVGNDFRAAGFFTRKAQSQIVFGRASSQEWPATVNLVQTRDNLQGGTLGTLIFSAQVGDSGGASATAAADFSGDGLNDMLLGAPNSQNGLGAIHLVSSAREYAGDVDLANTLTTPQSYGRIDGGSDDGRFGESVTRIGDFNGDGRDDYAVSAPVSAENAGRVYVLLGPNPGNWTGVRRVSDMVANGGAIRIAGSGDERLGASLAAAGDVDGDGLADLLIGAQNSSTTARAYVLFGRRNAPSEIAATDNSLVYDGNSGDDSTGRAVAGGGDFDADGSSELVIAAPFDDLNGSNSGSVYVVFGDSEDATPRLNGSLSHAWYDRDLPGQGVLTEFGTLNGQPAMFATWYTFENGKPRWLTSNLEPFTDTVRSVESELFVTSGGGFGDGFDASNVVIESWGRVRVTLTDCDRLVFEWERTSDGTNGRLLLTPVLADLLGQDRCSHDSGPGAASADRTSRGLVGTLWNPARAGEGVVIDIEDRGGQPTLFFSWFTYGQGGNQVWLVGSGPFNPATGEALGLTVFQARGTGLGPAFDPADVELLQWGSVDLSLPGCAAGNLRYNGAFPGGAAFSGEIDLVRFTEGLHDFSCRD